MRAQRWAPLVTLTALAASACYDPRVRPRLRCGPHGECPGDQRCVDDVCGGEPVQPDGGPVFFDADLIGPYDLTVQLGGAPGAKVRSVAPGIDCGLTCRATYQRGTQVVLHAVLDNGSGLRFAGWRGACAGIDVECRLTMDGPRDVTALFELQTHNLVFATRMPMSTRLTGAALYDARCNLVASDAGINDAGGTAFMAWTSDTGSTALQRLTATGARGFVRMDGLAFTDRLSELVGANVVFNPVLYDEGGRELHGNVATGTTPLGQALSHCAGWTGGDSVAMGNSDGGPLTWTYYTFPTCSLTPTASFYCFQRTFSAAIVDPTIGPAHKRLFVTRSSHTPGGGLVAADDLCAREGPPSSFGWKALLPRGTQPASAMLDASTLYVSMQGHIIGSGRELMDNARLRSGIWQHADLGFFGEIAPSAPQVLTGTFNPTEPGPVCGDLTVTSTGYAAYGMLNDTDRWWSRNRSVQPCGTAMRLYCVQQ